MRYLLLAPAIIFILSNNIYAQVTEDLEEYYREGDYFFNRGDYEEAVYYFLILVKNCPDNANFNFKVGECYLQIPGKETKSIPFFEKSITNVTRKKKYKRKSFGETKAPLHAYFYLGNAYRINNQLDKALEAYNTFVNSPYYYNNYNQMIVENEIKSCERAKIIEDSPTSCTKIPLNNKINTSANELNPVISGDEKSMVFTRKLKFYDAIFYSKIDDDDWSEPVNINPQIISDGDFYPASLSFNGKELYLIRKSAGGSDIYISHLIDGTWSEAEKLSKMINSSSNETHACISEDGKFLYFTRDRRRGMGGLDIYVSGKNNNSHWGKPKNLGKVINTKFDEDTPFITGNNKRLFFSSKGHYNMGGFDIFYSDKETHKWSIPVNIGYPVNNTGDNLFYVPLRGGIIGYVSLFSDENKENRDIYRLEINSNIPQIKDSTGK
jgi:tetratricopeptide (TPR) repeat protein